jgi:hypothetical protein
MPIILQELHGRVIGGHFSYDIIVKKILDANYWWPTMNQIEMFRNIIKLVINVKE